MEVETILTFMIGKFAKQVRRHICAKLLKLKARMPGSQLEGRGLADSKLCATHKCLAEGRWLSDRTLPPNSVVVLRTTGRQVI